FVDDRDDVELYNYKSMSKAIVEAILNKKINNDGGKKMHKYTIAGAFVFLKTYKSLSILTPLFLNPNLDILSHILVATSLVFSL
ncbi:hypothetical protein ACTPEM_26605, partial [Clostridioides difficile]